MTTGASTGPEPLVTLAAREREAPPAAGASHGPPAVRVHPRDDVAVLVRPQPAGATLEVDGARVTLAEDVAAGHKVALRAIAAGEAVHKYGMPIGAATAAIPAGAWVHSHNLATRLSGELAYHRGAAGAPSAEARPAAGDDLRSTQRVLAGLLRHPNAGGVLVLGLGCENNQLDQLLAAAGDAVDRTRLRWFNTQEVDDEIERGLELVGELVAHMADDRRAPCPASALVLGHKCGGSDGFSGITANPLLGRLAERVTALGGGVILTEVPEMFGAEQVLLDRTVTEATFDDLVAMVNDFKAYFLRHGQPVYENPSPGNKAGGLTTLEEKSLGAIQKGGLAPVRRVLRYGAPWTPDAAGGLALLEAPGNDGVSSTAMVASGATMLLFTTGRGTPLGFPVPTVKVSSNSAIAARKPHWIDFDAGRLLDGSTTLDALADELLAFVLDVASGRPTNNERHGYREIAIWKEGVTL
jgi:altronate hydrolase